MATKIARNDAPVVRQVTNITPNVLNASTYDLIINGKQSASYLSDGAATAQEIVEGLAAVLEESTIPEFVEIAWTEDDVKVIATGRSDGQPFGPITDGTGTGTYSAIANAATVAKSPNHWIAENFDTGTLPANGDDVILQGLRQDQSFYWGLDHNTVQLGSLDIRADSEAFIGLPEINQDSSPYYQATYRNTHLKIGVTALKVGDGVGNGSGRLKLDVGTTAACDAVVYSTSNNPADQDEAPLHLVGGHANNALQLFSGWVDIAMLPGYTGQWPTIIAAGGKVRCGAGVTLGVVEAGGSSIVETRSAIATARTRGDGKIIHIGSGGITALLDIDGGSVEIRATGALTIAELRGYSGRSLDLSKCDSAVTITNGTIYATPASPFEIKDPNNRLTMTNPFSTPNGAQSLRIITGSGRNVRVT